VGHLGAAAVRSSDGIKYRVSGIAIGHGRDAAALHRQAQLCHRHGTGVQHSVDATGQMALSSIGPDFTLRSHDYRVAHGPVDRRHIHEAIRILQYCRPLDIGQLAGDAERSGFDALTMEHHRRWARLRDYRHFLLCIDRLRNREKSLPRALAARFSLVAAMVDSGHSPRRRPALDLFANENIFADLRHDLSADACHGDQEHAVRHTNDQKCANSAWQRFGRSLEGVRRNLAPYFSPSDLPADHAGADYRRLSRFYLRGARYQHCGVARVW